MIDLTLGFSEEWKLPSSDNLTLISQQTAGTLNVID